MSIYKGKFVIRMYIPKKICNLGSFLCILLLVTHFWHTIYYIQATIMNMNRCIYNKMLFLLVTNKLLLQENNHTVFPTKREGKLDYVNNIWILRDYSSSVNNSKSEALSSSSDSSDEQLENREYYSLFLTSAIKLVYIYVMG